MRPQRPQDLVFTLYGEYFLERRDSVWVGSLITLLGLFDMSEASVRTVLSRMTRKGWLESNRVGRNSFYDLSQRGRTLLEEGTSRIFHPSWDMPWDGRWYLLSYSIPEDQRHLRDRMRDRLAWLGFGSLGNGLWISPHDVDQKVREAAGDLGIQGHIECFRGQRVGEQDPSDLVKKCWDLDELNQKYGDFLQRWKPQLARFKADHAQENLDHSSCFTARFTLLHEFRSFPLEDPFLPRRLLPAGWLGEEASIVFRDFHDLLQGPAESFLDGILTQAPQSPALAGDPA